MPGLGTVPCFHLQYVNRNPRIESYFVHKCIDYEKEIDNRCSIVNGVKLLQKLYQKVPVALYKVFSLW